MTCIELLKTKLVETNTQTRPFLTNSCTNKVTETLENGKKKQEKKRVLRYKKKAVEIKSKIFSVETCRRMH